MLIHIPDTLAIIIFEGKREIYIKGQCKVCSVSRKVEKIKFLQECKGEEARQFMASIDIIKGILLTPSSDTKSLGM
jgi:hypothetical protein